MSLSKPESLKPSNHQALVGLHMAARLVAHPLAAFEVVGLSQVLPGRLGTRGAPARRLVGAAPGDWHSVGRSDQLANRELGIITSN